MMAMPLRRCRIAGILTLLLALVIPITPNFDARAATDLIVGGQAQVSDAQGDNVNLRDAPSYSGAVLTSVPEGSIVDVLDGPVTDPADGTVWYFVNASGQPGYMISDYLVNADGAVSPAAVATTTAKLVPGPDRRLTFAVVVATAAGLTAPSALTR
jgi:hypothetical protein